MEAADAHERPCAKYKAGLVGRLEVRSVQLARVGKEIDRLEEGDGVRLDQRAATTYGVEHPRDLTQTCEVLRRFLCSRIAAELGVSERRMRDVLKGRAYPRARFQARMHALARALMPQHSGAVGLERTPAT